MKVDTRVVRFHIEDYTQVHNIEYIYDYLPVLVSTSRCNDDLLIFPSMTQSKSPVISPVMGRYVGKACHSA